MEKKNNQNSGQGKTNFKPRSKNDQNRSFKPKSGLGKSNFRKTSESNQNANADNKGDEKKSYPKKSYPNKSYGGASKEGYNKFGGNSGSKDRYPKRSDNDFVKKDKVAVSDFSYSDKDKPKFQPKNRMGSSRTNFSKDNRFEKKPYGTENRPFKKFDDRKEGGEKRFEKKTYGTENRPFKKFDDRKEGGEKRFEKKTYGTENRPFKKFDDRKEGGEKRFEKKTYGTENRPFKKFDDRKEGGEKKPYNSENRPFKKFDDRKEGGEKRFEKKTYGSENRPFKKFDDRKEGGEKKPYNSENRPFKKFDDRKEGGEKRFEKKTYGSENRPFKKFDDRKEGGEKKPYNSENRPFKKFDKTENQYSNRKGTDYKTSNKGFEKKFEKQTNEPKPFVSDEKNVVRKRERFTVKNQDNFKKRPQYDNFKKPFAKKFEENNEETENVRLNRYIANSGVCSRREADELITEGKISVNGVVMTELGYQVKPTDSVMYNGKLLRKEPFVYVLLNKPKDYITTTDDPEDRNTVMDLVRGACNERIYPVGRLDRDTTGLLLLTNDGALAQKLTHPSYEMKKIYQIELNKALDTDDLQKLLEGVELEDGKATVDDAVILNPEKTLIGLEIHLGRNRIVRRIFEQLGYEVIRLDRTMFAGLTKKDISRGKWRYLSEKEVVKLKFMM